MILYERFSLIVFSEVTGSRKKKIWPRTVLPCFYVIIDGSMKGLWVKVQTFQTIENETLWAESSTGIAWQRPINVCVGMHFKQSFFVYYVKNREFIINPDDRMFFLFTTSPSIVDNKLRFLYILSILTVKHRLEPGVCCCLSPGGALGYFWGGYVLTGTPNWHPILKKISPKIDTPF